MIFFIEYIIKVIILDVVKILIDRVIKFNRNSM